MKTFALEFVCDHRRCTGPRVRIYLKSYTQGSMWPPNQKNTQAIFITPDCVTPQEFEESVLILKKGLDECRKEANRHFDTTA